MAIVRVLRLAFYVESTALDLPGQDGFEICEWELFAPIRIWTVGMRKVSPNILWNAVHSGER